MFDIVVNYSTATNMVVKNMSYEEKRQKKHSSRLGKSEGLEYLSFLNLKFLFSNS